MKEKERPWKASQLRFMAWLSTPAELREPDERTEVQYAAKYSVGTVTLWRWKRLPGFWDEVQKLTQQYLSDTVPEGLKSLKEMVRRGSFPHQKMYFEMVGLYVPKQENRNEGTLTIKIEYADPDPTEAA